MIIVNTGGDVNYAPLEHARWHGCTPTDLVFPSFLFAVGNAMSFAMKKYELMGDGAVLRKIFKRTILIFLIGYLMYWFPFVRIAPDGALGWMPISHTRILGVLQRIALCYCFASLLIHYCTPRTVFIIVGILLLGYWASLLLFHVPGADPYSMTGNAGYRLDKWILGENHMYHGEGVAFDPEGILSTFPAIVNVIAGYFTGSFVQQKGKTYEGLAKLLLMGSLLLAVAVGWDMVFPINKKLWTSSYVLYTVGIDMIFLSFLIYVIDYRQKTRWTNFFAVFGKNPLFIYVLSEILIVILYMVRIGHDSNLVESVNAHFYQYLFPGAFGSLLFALSYMLICWSVGKWLDWKKIYIRV
jgi:predicted acyltransferase